MVNNSKFYGIRKIAADELSHLLPGSCPVCEQRTTTANTLCETCLKLFENQSLNLDFCCLACALPLPITDDCTGSDAPHLYCPDCQDKKPNFERCVPAVPYNRLTGKLVHCLKNGQLSVLQPITQQIVNALSRLGRQPIDLIVPVPLHPRRLSKRGYNQSVEIARHLGKRIDVPVDCAACHRRRNDPPQQSLNRARRKRNLSKAFEFRRRLSGYRVAIVDDVVTTGATGNALAKEALEAGAISVELWCYARTPAPASSK